MTIAGIGDPRFTPDKQETKAGPWEEPAATVEGTGKQLAATIRSLDQPVDIALVHDPASATALRRTTTSRSAAPAPRR